MKLKLIERRPLMSTCRTRPKGRLFRPTRAPLEEKKAALYDAIEHTQAFMHKTKPTDALMARVRRRYPAPLYFIESNRQALEHLGLGRLDAFYYSMIPSLTRTSLSQQWGMNPKLDTLFEMADYLRTLYVGVHVECFYLILLDRGGRLIRPVLLQRGGVDNAPFYLGDVLSTALQDGVRYTVLSHNHPGGTRRASKEDVACTLRTLNAFMPLHIPLLDHIIVAGDQVVSIRLESMIPEVLWRGMIGNDRVVRSWTLPER